MGVAALERWLPHLKSGRDLLSHLKKNGLEKFWHLIPTTGTTASRARAIAARFLDVDVRTVTRNVSKESRQHA